MVALRECRRALPIKSALQVEHGTMSALSDSSRTAPTWELIDDLLDNRPKIYQSAKMALLARLANTKKEHLIELVAMEAEHSKPASK